MLAEVSSYSTKYKIFFSFSNFFLVFINFKIVLNSNCIALFQFPIFFIFLISSADKQQNNNQWREIWLSSNITWRQGFLEAWGTGSDSWGVDAFISGTFTTKCIGTFITHWVFGHNADAYLAISGRPLIWQTMKLFFEAELPLTLSTLTWKVRMLCQIVWFKIWLCLPIAIGIVKVFFIRMITLAFPGWTTSGGGWNRSCGGGWNRSCGCRGCQGCPTSLFGR